jgi:hypothetical protein
MRRLGVFSKERLCLQILHGQVSAFVVMGGRVLRAAHADALCGQPDLLPQIFGALIQQLNFRGEYVSTVISDEAIGYQMVPTPPMKPTDLRMYLQRKSLQESRGKEALRFGWTTLKAREGAAVLLQVIPDSWVRVFVESCHHHGLQPLHFMTASAVACLHVGQVEPGMPLYALDTGTSTVLVVRKFSDAPVLLRELSGAWQKSLDGPLHVAQEIQRTLLFAKQQLGMPVDRIHIRGNGSELLASVTRDVVGLDVGFNEDPVVWALPLQNRDRANTANLLDARELLVNSERRRAVLVALVMMVMLGGMLFSLVQVRSALNRMEQDLKKIGVQQEIIRFQDHRDKLSSIRAEIGRNQKMGQQIYLESHRPFAGWLSGAIADMIPDEMVLSRLWIRSDTQGQWIVDIHGSVPRNPVVSSQVLKELQTRLVSIPARFQVEASWELTWISNLQHGSTWEGDEMRKPFQIHGVAQ